MKKAVSTKGCETGAKEITKERTTVKGKADAAEKAYAEEKAITKENRKVTIYNGRGDNYGRPLIMLQGKWLQDLGFSVGDKLTIVCEENRLVIEHFGETQEGRAGRTSVGMVAEPGVDYQGSGKRNR